MTSFIPKGWSTAFTQEKRTEDGESLLTVLPTAQERGALTILIADCTEVMRQNILDIFDAKQTGIAPAPIEELTDEMEEQLVLSPEADLIHTDEAEQSKEEKAKRALERRQKEVAAANMVELKKEAVAHFDTWRQAVVLRIGEIVNSRKVAEEQKEAAEPHTEGKSASTQPLKLDKPTEHASVGLSMTALYPPVANTLVDLEEEKRALILHSVLLILLSLESYTAYSRILLLRLATSLKLSTKFLADDEAKVAQTLLTAAEGMKAEEETKAAAESNKDSRAWRVGLATVAGAALIGITGGLAAPLLAAGIGSVMGGLGLGATAAAGYLGTLAGSSVLVGGLFGAYGGRMTGQMMDQYAREVEDFGFVPVRTYHRSKRHEKEYRRLRVAIGISGWLTDKDEVVAPWRVVGTGLESFALRFELESLLSIGNALTTMITSAAWGYAKSEIIKRTVFAALTAGLWPLGLLKVSRIIDNPWSVANYRAIKAGEVLAEALINKAQGERPVTLVGYSLGAKVISVCLQRLAERKAFGLVESVVLIGTPTASDSVNWRAMRAVVTGRVVNVYSTKDYILGFCTEAAVSSSAWRVCNPLKVFLAGTILRKLGFEDVDSEELEKEQKALREEELKEQKERQKNEEASGKELSDADVQNLENEVERRNKQSYLDWASEKAASVGSTASGAFKQATSQVFQGKAAPNRSTEKDSQIPAQPENSITMFDVDAPAPGQAVNQKETAHIEGQNAIL
ncbi:hypothetical protein AMS68_003595 [Peltaster fructicola]|uniref:DUF726-domain-containing protein n=1 Tax=Peltaster fructicola TaxID=286661 RepID=A0A6H0XTY8_9PEZI|nr:hypothetical protein AMS68_003595 [Peltaster fructicola]